jgi:mono/diheme cytochrome c family protein
MTFEEASTKNIKISSMRCGYLLIAILTTLLFFQCATRNKITYNIPANLPEANRKKLVEVLDKGQALYKENCTDCHGIFTKGKDGIPDFTNRQIDNYSARFLRRDPKNHAVFIKMSPEQLNEVLAFLRYKNPRNADSAVVKRAN